MRVAEEIPESGSVFKIKFGGDMGRERGVTR